MPGHPAAEPRDDRVALPVGEVDVEALAARIIRRQDEPEQPLLSAGDHRARQIKEVGGEHRAAAAHADVTVLLDDEEDIAVGRIGHHGDRRREADASARACSCADTGAAIAEIIRTRPRIRDIVPNRGLTNADLNP